MKNEYKSIYDKITPDDELTSSVLAQASGESKRVPFKPNVKKIIAAAAAFAIILSVGMVGVPRLIDSDKNVTTANPTVNSSPLDFQIVAYAEDDPNGTVKELKDGDITLMDAKLELKHDKDGYYIHTRANQGFGVKAQDVDYVIFKSETGTFSYFDGPLRAYLARKNEYYAAVIPLTDEEAAEYESTVGENGNGQRDVQNFLKKIMANKDCSQYIYDEKFNSESMEKYFAAYSTMADEEVNYYEHCIVATHTHRLQKEIMQRGQNITARVYQENDKIEGIYYSSDGAERYLLEHPDTPYNELPTDTITITVHYKTGQTITKQILTSFNDDGVMQMQYK